MRASRFKKDAVVQINSMIETRRLKNVVIFVQTILSFVLSRKISSSSVVTFIPVKQYRNCILLIHMKNNAHRCNLA